MGVEHSIKQLFELHILNNIYSISIPDIMIVCTVSLLVGIYISIIYKLSTDKLIYSANFSIMLIAINIITSAVIMVLTSNVLLSIGMIGSLSIIRFRTAIKEPMDIAFIFWSITSAIIIASGMIHLAVISSLIVGAIIIIKNRQTRNNKSYLVIIKYTVQSEDSVLEFINKQGKYTIKNKTIQDNIVEIHIEIELKHSNTKELTTIANISGVKFVSAMLYNGEYLG